MLFQVSRLHISAGADATVLAQKKPDGDEPDKDE